MNKKVKYALGITGVIMSCGIIYRCAKFVHACVNDKRVEVYFDKTLTGNQNVDSGDAVSPTTAEHSVATLITS
jgi:hypothetical protein